MLPAELPDAGGRTARKLEPLSPGAEHRKKMALRCVLVSNRAPLHKRIRRESNGMIDVRLDQAGKGWEKRMGRLAECGVPMIG